MRTHLLLPAVLAAAVVANSTVQAGLIAYDGFNYGPAGSDLIGNNGGLGFAGGWAGGGFNASIHDNYDNAAGSLAFGSLLTSGQSVATSAQNAISGLTRSLAAPLGDSGTTRYLSFVIEPRGTVHDGVFNGFFGVLFERSSEPEVFMGKPGGGSLEEYVIEDRGGSGQFSSGVSVVADVPAFIVVKAEFGDLSDIFTMYVNPTPGAPEPAAGIVKTVDLGAIEGLTFYSTGAHALDELRLGETFADVTPVAANVPDSAPGLLGCAALLGILGLGRRLGMSRSVLS